MMARVIGRLGVLVVAAGLPVFAGPPAIAPAQSPTCAKHAHALVSNSLVIVWHAGDRLHSCTTVDGARLHGTPRMRTLGPWARGTKVDVSGVDVAWTVPATMPGVDADRVWAASAESGVRWLTGTRIDPGTPGGHFRDGRVRKIMAADGAAGWLTMRKQLVLAVHRPLGDPTPFSKLTEPVTANKQLVLAGTFPAIALDTLAVTATLRETAAATDACQDGISFALTVHAFSASPQLGVRWTGAEEGARCR
jgi:hypothetical protein